MVQYAVISRRQLQFICLVLSLFLQVVERLLALPVEYWSQFMMVDQEHPHPDHMIIENANCYATPDQKGESLFNRKILIMYGGHSALTVQDCITKIDFCVIIVFTFFFFSLIVAQ